MTKAQSELFHWIINEHNKADNTSVSEFIGYLYNPNCNIPREIRQKWNRLDSLKRDNLSLFVLAYDAMNHDSEALDVLKSLKADAGVRKVKAIVSDSSLNSQTKVQEIIDWLDKLPKESFE